METLDVFDELYNPLDPPTASIDEVHKKGLWHQTFACWVVNPHKNTILLQLRGPRNRIDPGSFDASASGHLASGEQPEDGFRELHEELGITVLNTDRAYLGKFRNIATRGNYINREFCHVFLAKSLVTPDALTLQDGEVSGVLDVGIDDAIDLFSGKTQSLKAIGIAWDGEAYRPSERQVSLPLMCNWHERCEVSKYYLKVMQAAKAFLQGTTIPPL